MVIFIPMEGQFSRIGQRYSRSSVYAACLSGKSYFAGMSDNSSPALAGFSKIYAYAALKN
ncbi:MAG TPA: hypothetical protein PKA28_17850 [Methylomusa anaerophila]|uniref:hypothetical protein n=1 Tax=Methylomusa anaerophila TaxID=1930071 RepID=UPI0011AE8139|nr:hypothetical protein [Methylomusa anaerophila]HML90308.1 hypothetical protein [Methylomusa anaerophila]